MKMRKINVFLMTVLLVALSTLAFGQSIVFSEAFTEANSSYASTVQIGTTALTANVSGVDWGCRVNNNLLEISNDASATANVLGWGMAYNTSALSSPYTTSLSSNVGVVTWSFNMRQIRTDPAGFATNTSYGSAFILAGSSNSASTAGNGYAIVLGQSGSTDPIRLAKYTNGLLGSTNITNIITSNTTGLTDFGAEYLSIKVTYTPSTNTWELFLRNDGTTAFADPLSGSLTTQGTAVDNTYTGTALAYLGAYWQGSTGGAQFASFDNIIVSVAGGGVTEPTNQPTTLVFNNVTSSSFDVSFTAASPAVNGYLAVRKSGSAPTTNPVDGTTYSAGNTLGDGTVAFSGSGVSFSQTSLSPSTTYYYKIYAYNGSGGTENYLLTTPLAGSQLTASGVVLATVTTTTISAVTDTSATGGGEVTSEGGGTVSARGVCWNTGGTPTISDAHTTDSSGIGVFTSSLTSLTTNQLYYVRAYATNGAGTAYGNQVQFTTLKAEPAAYVTNFAAGTTTSGSIPLTWTDATADGYLIKGSTVSYFDIVHPEDGTAETNSTLVRNVTQGTQTYTFTGLEQSTTYYFRIFPYTNSGTNINYKIDGTIPSATAATSAASTTLYPGDIAIIAINTDTERSFVFAALADIPANTTITFTDNPWTTATGPMGTAEGNIQWSYTSILTKGSTVTIALPTTFTASVGTVTTSANFALSTSGDQIIAFVGDWANRPTDANDSRFLYALSTENFIDTAATSSNTSYLPAALTSYSIALTTSSAETDDAYFANGATAQASVSVTGTKTELLALFNDRTKYFLSDTILTYPTYSITVGTGGSVTQPTAQPTNLQFSSVGANAFEVAFTAASPTAEGYIAVRKVGSAPTTDPVDGTSYSVGNSLGDGIVAYRSSGTSFSQASLSPSTAYYYKIYSFNGSGTATDYLVASPLAGNQTTTASDPFSGYYTSVAGLTGSSLKAGLHTLIRNTHTTEFSYTATETQLAYTDQDSLNPSNLIETYTGWSVPAANYGGGVTDWNKEHTWSKSHGDFGDVAPAGTDLHHLRPCDATVNSAKNNRDFDEGSTPYTDASPYPGYSGVTGCSTSTDIWEPRDVEKGDVARMLFYMATRYEGDDTSYDLELVDYENSAPAGQPLYGNLTTLLAWHNADPPDAWEIRRNNRIQERQGNRNPFIDHPEYVASIWGGASAPAVTTTAITSIGATTATGGGEVTAAGTSSVTARGICWNTTGSPTLANSYTTDGSGIGTFVSSLTSLTTGQLYYVRAYATNSVGTTYGNEVTFTTVTPEPANHVTNFAAGTPTTTTIPLAWTDATAAGYLIKGSAVGYGDIAAPVDGTTEANSTLVRNVAQGTQAYTFTGLSQSTTYYFMIYPYTNSGTSIDYKTDGTVPQASALTATGSATLLLEENFEYTAATFLHDNGWLAHSGAGTTPPIVGAVNLTYTDYPSSSGLCGETVNTGEDVNKPFDNQTSGDIYTSFLINVTSSTESGDYVFNLGSNPIGSDYKGKFFVGRDASNNVRFGITKSANIGTAVAWTGYDYAYGTTYLVVIKYSIIAGLTNDVVTAWINPAYGPTEPTPLLSAVVGEVDISGTGIGSVAIRQSNVALTAKFDGIRVATSWAALLPSLTDPTISTMGTLDAFTAIVGTPSVAQTYTVTGSHLTTNITVTAPTGFELSLTGSRTWGSSVEVPQTGGSANSTVYVRFNPATVGVYPSADISHVATGATSVYLSVSGHAYTGEILVTESLIPFTAVAGTPSSYQTYHLTGSTLFNYIDIVVTGPFQVRDTMHPSPTWETTLSLAPDYDGDIDVRYNPVTAGTQSGHITHSIDGGEAATVVVDLSGTATDPSPAISVNPAVMTFSTGSGTTSDAQLCTITSANLTSLINIASPGAYTFSGTQGGSYSNPYQITSNYNGTLDLWIKFSPASIGTFVDSITVSSGTASDVIHLTSYGLDPNNTYATDLFFSEYIEGNSNNKALEIFNGTGHSVDLSDYVVYLYANGAPTPNYTLSLTGTLANNDVYVISNSAAVAGILALADITSTVTYFNGDDALGLYKVSTASYVDVFGRIGDDPGTAWTGDGGYSTLDKTLVRKASVSSGITTSPTGTGPTAFTTLTTEWDLYNVDTYSNLGMHTFAPGASPAAAPTILPAPGVKTAPIMVSMSTTTPSGEIRYTTNGSDPTDTSTLYSTSFEVSSTTTIKARTFAAGYAPSTITTASYIYPTNIANLAALRAIPLPSTNYYKLTNEVVLTLKSTTRNSKYVQDATGAVLIDDLAGKITTSYNLGDGITGLVGTIAAYTGMLQFTPAADPGAASSTGNVITPQTVTLAALDSTYQAKLVKVTGVSILGATGNFATTAMNYNIQDDSGLGVLRNHYLDLDYIGTPIPTVPKTITGIILQYSTTTTVFQLIPRSLADIADGTPPDAPIDVQITIVGDNLRLSWYNDPTVTNWTVWAADEITMTFENIGTFAVPYCDIDSLATASSHRYFYVVANR